MKRSYAIALLLSVLATAALAASGKQPPPPGAFEGAPPQYTRFSTHELMRGFMALAFGSDLRIGPVPRGIRRFDHPISAHIIASGSIDRTERMTRVLEEYAQKVPNLRLTVTPSEPADMEVRLIDEKDFNAALREAFGAKIAKAFIKRTDPQCMTSVKSDASGDILHAVSFVIVDQGDDVFLDCAYHEMLHAFGLSNHDQHNLWTTLNQNRMVGYLSVYDRDLLTLLYDPRIKPGMTRHQVRRLLPHLIADLGLTSSGRRE
jgi:hypothetical protein